MSSPPPTTQGGQAAPAGFGGAPMGASARRRAERRERIFETALCEFRDVGFAAAQIDRIAGAAGVARGVFYFYFPTKDDVLLELARRINRRIVLRISTLGDSNPSLRELLTWLNDAIMDEHGRVGDAGLLAEMLSLYARRPHDLRDSLHNVPTLADELARHLRSAAERGELRPSMAVEQLGIVIMTSLFGLYSRIPPGDELRAMCDALIDLLVKGLQSDA